MSVVWGEGEATLEQESHLRSHGGIIVFPGQKAGGPAGSLLPPSGWEGELLLPSGGGAEGMNRG